MRRFRPVLQIKFPGPPGDIECGIVRPVNPVTGDFVANGGVLLAARLEPESLDDIAHQTRSSPSSTARSHHHE
jgi:hypothetical protein